MGPDPSPPAARRGPRRARRWVRDLAGDLTGHDAFTQLLGLQVQAAHDGVEALLAFTREPGEGRSWLRALAEIEARGDRARAAVVAELTKKLVTPIDREDLFRFSRSLDDVLDNINDLGRELDLYQTSGEGLVAALLDHVVDGLHALRGAVDLAMASSADARGRVLDVKRAATRVRRGYQDALATLFGGDLTMDVLKQREVLRRLDVVGLRLGEAADSLADGLVKRHR